MKMKNNFTRGKFKRGVPFYANTRFLSILVLFMLISIFQSFAQTDVTNTYLTNAGFDINCNYLSGGTDTVSTADPGNNSTVYGWTLTLSPAWSASGTFEYGWNGILNGASAPASGFGNGMLGLTVGWNSSLSYYQTATLPAGTYSIEFSAFFQNNTDINANLTGWIGDDGYTALSDFTSVPSTGNWHTGSATLRLYTQSSGRIQVGTKAFNSGSGSNARVFIDNLKIISSPVTKAGLQAFVDSANVMLANQQPVPPGSTAYANLSATVSDAQAVLDNGSASVNDIFTAEDNMKIAIAAVYRAILAYGLTPVDNINATYSTYTNQQVSLTGKGQLTLTGVTDPLSGSVVNLASEDVWIYFPNMLPSEVANNLLSHFLVDTNDAVVDVNIRISQYLKGAMVIPHSSTYEALTVYDGTSHSGGSVNIPVNQYFKTTKLGSMDNNIESFTLKRGYMATFASNEDGTGTSRVYIADKADINVYTMPAGLANTASFVIVRQWRWTVKKGVRAGSEDALLFNAGSMYDYNNVGRSTLDVEYVPMRHNPGWNAYSNFNDQYTATHALYYNEPANPADGETSTVAEAIAEYPNMMTSGLRLGTPANTDGNLAWLYDFVDQCDALGYRVDFVAWHFYRAGYTASSLYNTLKAVHDRTGRPLWITEFNNGCNWTYNGNVPTIEENGVIIDQFIKMMDTTSFIERYYVWNGCNEELRMTNSSTGELYPAGVAYQALESGISYTEDYYNGNTFDGRTIQENGPGFCNADGSIGTYYSGYTGSGYVNVDAGIGVGIDYRVDFTTTGTKTITIRYASTSDRPADIIVNGSVAYSDVYMPSTGSFAIFSEVTVPLYLNTGETDIRIESKTADGLGNIDYIQVSDAIPVDCGSVPVDYPIIYSVTEQQTDNLAPKILDGDDTDGSRWSADGFPQTVVIDYGENKSITGTRVSTYQDRAYQFTIDLDDNPNFTSPYSIDRSANSDASQPISDDFASVSARFVRITVTGASGYTGTWVSITEFEIIEDVAGNIAPATSITSPANNSTFVEGDNVTINATASDSDGSITNVDFYLDGVLQGTDNTSPYSHTLNNMVAGNYALTAIATDNLGATGTSSIVDITVNPNTAPLISITSPANNASFNEGDNVDMGFSASDADGSVVNIDIYMDGILQGNIASPLYPFAINNVPAGNHVLSAVATDDKGATTTSSEVNITVVPSANEAPAVSITSPANNASFIEGDDVTINVSASDSDGIITSVAFYQDGLLLGTANTSPYAYTISNIAAGSSVLTAVATDDGGATTTSSGINITVDPGAICNPVILSVTSEQAGNLASKILDGDDADASRWSANGFPQTVVIDYGCTKSIIGTRLSTYQDRAYQFTIELDNNAGFISPYVVDRSSNTSASQPISDDFAAVSARYVRITVTGASGYNGPWVSLTEFVVVEQGSGNSPIVWYQLNETSGTTATDASGNGNDATLNGGASFVAGQSTNAVSLNGTDGYVLAPAGILSSVNDMTISTWVNLNAASTWSRIFDFGSGTTANMFLTPNSGSGTLRFAITSSGNGGEQRIDASSALVTGTWKHLAVTLSGNTGTLYVDGTIAGTNTSLSLNPSDMGSTANNYIGRSQYPDPYLNGMVDDFRIYNIALSQAEISTLFSDGIKSSPGVVENGEYSLNMQVYPNPVQTELSIEVLNYKGSVQVDFYAMDGRLENQLTDYVYDSKQILVPSWGYKGLCLVKVKTEEEVDYFKVMFK